MGLSYKALARGIVVTLFILLICVAIVTPFIKFTWMGGLVSPVASVINNDPYDQKTVDITPHIDRMQMDTSEDGGVSTTQQDTAFNSDTPSSISYKVIADRADALDKHPVLMENPNAHDPTYQELMDFLSTDDTVHNKYVNPNFTCADFATELQNHAESHDIRCGYTGLNFEGKSNGHAIDVFDTVDDGLVYVDTTGGKVHVLKNLQVGDPYYKVGIISAIKNYW
jgi:hypothetical protein